MFHPKGFHQLLERKENTFSFTDTQYKREHTLIIQGHEGIVRLKMCNN